MFSEEAYGLVTSLNCLNHIPACSVLTDEVSLTKFCDLVVCLTFCVYDLFKIFVLERIFTNTVGLILIFFFFVIIFFIVELWNSSWQWVTIHIVLHLLHIANHTTGLTATRLNWCKLSCI